MHVGVIVTAALVALVGWQLGRSSKTKRAPPEDPIVPPPNRPPYIDPPIVDPPNRPPYTSGWRRRR